MSATLGRLSVGVDEAARLIGVSTWSIHALIRKGELKSRKVGGRRLITIAELERIVAAED